MTHEDLLQAIQSLNAEDAFRPRLDPSQWRTFLQYLTRHELRAGDLLVKQGEVDRTLYFLGQGTLQVYAVAAPGAGGKIAILRPGGMMDLMREMSAKGLGATAIVDEAGRAIGIFTDGDLRRLLERGVDLRNLLAAEVMHPEPRTVREDALAVDAADLMEAARITSVLVADSEGRLIGALNTNDLLRAKVI